MNTKVNEGKSISLISGRDALIALANGQDVEYMDTSNTFKSLGWGNAFGLKTNLFFSDLFKFRLKQHTITINGIEVPAPFEPKKGEKYYHISLHTSLGYGWDEWEGGSEYDERVSMFGAWRTEEEIKQVVAAIRQVFGGSHDN